jgi:hypothetical protein
MHLRSLCEKTEAGQTETGFTTPILKNAAAAMKLKLLKYGDNLNCMQAKIELVLDPRSSNESSDTTARLTR